MESFALSSENVASHPAQSGLAHTSDADKCLCMSDSSSPHSIPTPRHELQDFHSLHHDKPSTKKTSGKRDTLMTSSDTDVDGILDITLHHAHDIHNICIYGKQDVYAKFLITHIQDAVYSTQPVRGGGKNPVFNQSLQILISKLDAVLKCELWMMSCARNYLEDQLLGFVLVPLCELMGMGKSTRDYALSSTDLFHTPAGMVSLSLMFYQRGIELLPSSSMGRCQVKLDVCQDVVSSKQAPTQMESIKNGGLYSKEDKESHGITMAVDYNNIEFPDLQAASENQELVSMYMKLTSDHSSMEEDPCDRTENLQQWDDTKVHACPRDTSMVQTSALEGDCEMALNSMGDDTYAGRSESASDDNDMLGDMELSSASNNQPNPQETRTLASKEEVSGMQAKDFSTTNTGSSQAITSPRSVSSSGGLSSSDENKTMGSSDGQESVSSFLAPPPLVSLSLDPEVPVIQQDIVDMYMKSMQQFTESLAKMKLPFDMDGVRTDIDVTNEEEPEKKGAALKKGGVASEPAGAVKDGNKVFYGSRAFF